MANAERGSKSRAIQEFLAVNPMSGPQQIVDGLKQHGVDVSFGLASAVKYRKKKRKVSAKRSANRTAFGSGPVSGSELIRRYIARHPGDMPKAIESGLKQDGVKVSLSLIGRVKYGKPPKAARRRKSRTHAVRVAARATSAMAITIEQLVEVKRFADSIGGAVQLRQALDTLEQLR